MRVYISADIEGVAGISHWDEADKKHADYPRFREQMQAEVRAACEGAVAAGATSIRVKDAHGSGRNLDLGRLPSCVDLVSGWAPAPAMMVQEIDESFDALVFVGYHDCAGSGANPLAHTLSGLLSELRLNGQPAAEFHLHALTAAVCGIPAVFLSGDVGICRRVRALGLGVHTVETNTGRGSSVVARHPALVVEEIRAGVEAALGSRSQIAPTPLSDRYVLELEYKDPHRAWRNACYPGARLSSDRCVVFETEDWMEAMRALLFLT